MNKKVTFVWLVCLSVVTAFSVFCAQLIAKDISVMAFVAASVCMGLFASDDPLRGRNNLFLLNMVILLLNGVIFLFCPPIRYIALIIIVLDTLYIFSFKSYRKVKKDAFVILGNRVLVPGERFYLWPFFFYDVDVFAKTQDWKTDPIVVYTQDGDLFARIKARVTFRLPDRSSIKGHSVIAKILSESITERIRKTAKDFALGKTASEILDKRTFVPLGLNLPFDGSVEITFIGLSTDK